MSRARPLVNGMTPPQDDLTIDQVYTLTNDGDGTEVAVDWTINEQPAPRTGGGADVIVNPGGTLPQPNATLHIRKEGSYRLTCTVDRGRLTERSAEFLIAVRQLKSHVRNPAFDETFEDNSDVGWQAPLTEIVDLLDAIRADPGLVVAMMGDTSPIGHIVAFTGKATIKAGLVGEEDVPLVMGTDATTTANVQRPLGLVVAAVDGGAVGSNKLVLIRRFGRQGGIALAATPGDKLYVSNGGALSLVPGTNLRRVGTVLSSAAGISEIYFDTVPYEVQGTLGVTGTGFVHITGGNIDPAAKLVTDSDVAAMAAIAGSKIVPNFGVAALTAGAALLASIITTGDVTIGGNLVVQGTTTTIDSTVVDIEARILHTNFAPIGTVPVPVAIAGLEVERGDTGVTKRDAAAILWDEANTRWRFAFQSAADDTNVGANLPILAQGATLSGLGGSGAGYATVSNTGLLGFTTTIAASSLAHGTAGQVLITDGGPLSAWTSLISVDPVTGSFVANRQAAANTFGDSITAQYTGSIVATMGVYNSTVGNGVLYLGANAAATSSNNYTLYADSANTLLNAGTTLGFRISNTSYMTLQATALVLNGGVANVEFTHGRGTFGGSGSEYKAALGPLVSFETADAGIWFVPAATTLTSANVSFWSDASNTYMNHGNGSAVLGFIVAGSTYLGAFNGAQARFYAGGSTSSNSALIVDWATSTQTQIFAGNAQTSMWIGTTKTGATLDLLAGFADHVMQLASGTQDGIPLGIHLAPSGHIRLTESWEITAQNSANTATFRIMGLDGANNMTIGGGGAATPAGLTISAGSSGLIGVSSGLIAWEAGSDQYLDQTAVHVRSAGHVEALTITPASTTSIIFTENASSGALIGYAARTSNASTSDLKIQGQYAWNNVGALGANRTPGSVVLDYGPPTNSSNTEGYVKVTRNDVFMWAAGANASAPLSQAMMWLGPGITPVSANCVMVTDGASFTYVNTPNGGALGWVLNDAAFVLYGTVSNVYYGGTSAAAPLLVDWAAPSTPIIASGTSATSFTLRTTKVGASVFIQTDNSLNAIQYDHPTNQIRTRYYDVAGVVQLSQTVDNVTDFVTWTMASSAWEFEWLVGSGEMVLANNAWAVGGGSAWWLSGSTTTVYVGGFLTTTAPILLDFTAPTTPSILSGTNATVLNVGTQKVGAHLMLQGDNAQDLISLGLSLIDIGAGSSPSILLGAATLYLSGSGSSYSGSFNLLDAGVFVQVDTTGGVATVNLPAAASLTSGSALFIVSDFAKTFGTNKCTFVRNGSQKINGVAQNFDADSPGAIYWVIWDGTDWVIRGT